MGRRLARSKRQASALTADVLAVIRFTAIQPRGRGRGMETPEQASERARFDVALVAVLSDAGLRCSEAAALIWDDGSGRITVVRSKTDVEAHGAVVAVTPAAWTRTATPPTKLRGGATGNRVAAWWAARLVANPTGRRCGTYDCSCSVITGA